jgi:hypothetical protein
MHQTKTWQLIESILSEDKKFRGDTFVTYSDLAKLLGAMKKPPPDKNGGVEFGNYQFDPTILALGDSPKGDIMSWHDDIGDALARATTDSAKQIGGGGMGGTMTKGNWGGKTQMSYAPKRPHHNDRLGSGMDRYDVVMVADIEMVMNRKGMSRPVATLRRIAWAPAMGDQAAREERLQGLLSGRKAELPRRPMADRPVLSRDDQEHQADLMRKASERDAVARKDAGELEPKLGGRGGSASNQSFKDKLAKMNKEYEPGSHRRERPTDPEDALFWTPEKPRR